METEETYPMRINKYLAQRNVCSRREADKLIEEKKISINGRLAVLGDKVREGDKVEIIKAIGKEYVYLAFNKPRGIITHSPQAGEKSIGDIFSFSPKVYPVGRLDKDSSGLIILTNDGRITGPILGPENSKEKEYVVRVNKPLDEKFVRNMGAGVLLDDNYRTKECRLKKLSNFTFSIILTEGKKRQIRRMCTALGFVVADLKRIRILNIGLGDLPAGGHRRILGKELEVFLSQIGAVRRDAGNAHKDNSFGLRFMSAQSGACR